MVLTCVSACGVLCLAQEHICLNVYDACGTRFNACATPETQAPCTNPNAPIPTHPPVCQPQEHHRMLLSKGRKPSTPAPTPKVPGVPETVTRDTCRSNLAFDYMTWQFRKGYKVSGSTLLSATPNLHSCMLHAWILCYTWLWQCTNVVPARV